MNNDQSAMSSTSSPLSTSSKRVTFSENVDGVEILSLYDYTPSEISASWFDENEMEDITKRCFKVLKKIESGKGVKYCSRGLEGHTAIGSIGKKKNRETAVEAVLTEQVDQWAENRHDDQAIADIYHRTSSSCQLWAQVIGKRDQEIADAIYDQDEIAYEGLVTGSIESDLIPSTKPILRRKPSRRSLHNILQTKNARAA